jgi:uncharacterized protein YjiS (DUF1127 family)
MERLKAIYGPPRTGHAGYAVIEGIAALGFAVIRTLRKWWLEHRTVMAQGRARDELHALSDRMLNDIGLRRNEIDSLYR